MDIHNPDDQLASLKAWWQQYGTALIAGVAIGLLLLGGLNYWKQYRAERAEAASVLYEKLLDSLQQGRNDEAGKTAATLVADYAATPYAGKAALLAARLRFEEQDLAGARQQLEWAVENAREAAVQHSARIRLGHLLLEIKEFDAALALTAVRDPGGFESEYAELKGDALLAKGDRDGARTAYQTALDKLPPQSPYQRLLAMKRDNLGPGASP